MTDVMKGVVVLEVAEHTFVPAAGAIMSDWGADVTKVEHAERGDAMRGLMQTGAVSLGGKVHVLLEHSNRGKRSIGIDLTTESGREVLYKLVEKSDVFITNKLPKILKKLKIDAETLREINPRLIYVRGTSHGARGPDANRGGYDMTAFWCRGSNAASGSPAEIGGILPQPGPAWGDSMGAMTIAGGIAAALFNRERTGEGTIVDVSLLATGGWAMAAGIVSSLQAGKPWTTPMPDKMVGPNPLVGIFPTSDGRYICLVMLQPAKYWADFCEHIDLPELANDERFESAEKLMKNADEGRAYVAEWISSHTFGECVERFQSIKGQWAPVQNTLEFSNDPQVIANGYMLKAETSEGDEFELVSTPVQFGEEPCQTKRAPDFNEHGDEVLAEIGLDMDQILNLRIDGAVT